MYCYFLIYYQAALEADLFTHFNHKLDQKLKKFIQRELDPKLQKFIHRTLNSNNPRIEHLKALKVECEHRIIERRKTHTGSEWVTDGQEDSQLDDYQSISKATRLLEEVKDIRDELNILKFLLKQQNDVWKKLVDGSYKKPMSKKSTDNIPDSRATERWRGPAYILNEIDEMDKMTERIQDSVRISSFLPMRRRPPFLASCSDLIVNLLRSTPF